MTSCDSLSVMRGPKRNADICKASGKTERRSQSSHTQTLCNIKHVSTHAYTDMFDRRSSDMFGHVCLFASGGALACLVMFRQTC